MKAHQRSLLPILPFVFSALLHAATSQRDLTVEVEASGTDVVLATISRLNLAGVFSDDNRFLRRVAYVESRDGLDSDTFRAGYNGGIWQVDESNFLQTIDTVANPILAEAGGIYETLLSELGLDWTAASWVDLRIPLISAVAARIFFEIADSDIPDIGDVAAQGEFWKSSGFNTNSEDTVERFIEDVTTLELEECPNRGIDLAFALDSSGSVGEVNFDLERQLVSDVVERFRVGPDATQFGVVSYSGFARVNFRFNNFTTREEVRNAAQEVEYFDIPVSSGSSTNTADALQRLRTEVFTEEGGARSAELGIPRVAVVITDGHSNVNSRDTIPSALALRNSGVTVYSVGVGNRLNMEELLAIASTEENVRLLRDFDAIEFAGLTSRITAEACIASVPVDIMQQLSIQLDQGEMSYFEYQVPDEGITITLERQEGSATLFASNKIQNPNAAFYDYRIDREGELFIDLEELLGNRERRDAEDDGTSVSLNGGDVLFVTVQGIGNTRNSFQIQTSLGNTITASSGYQSRCVLSLLLVSLFLTLYVHW